MVTTSTLKQLNGVAFIALHFVVCLDVNRAVADSLRNAVNKEVDGALEEAVGEAVEGEVWGAVDEVMKYEMQGLKSTT